MAEPKFNEKNGVELSQELKSSLDLIQDATFVPHHNDLMSYSHQFIASPHMPPHQYLPDSDDEMDETDDDYEFVNDDDYEDSDIDDSDHNEKIKLEVFSRPPSRLGRPLSNPYKRSPKRNGPSVDRIKMENAFLKNQNNKLAQELEQCRVTIQALKNIVTQKDLALQSSRSENQKVLLQARVLEALILSKHSKDGSIIVRSGGVGDNNLPSIASLLQDKESLKRMDVSRKPVQSVQPAVQPVQNDQNVQQELDSLEIAQSQTLTHPPPLETATNNSEIVVSDEEEEDLIPPPLPPKRVNRRNNIRRWSMDFGTNNCLGQEEVLIPLNTLSMSTMSTMSNLSNMSSNITQVTSSDDNTIISSSGTTPSSSTLTPTNSDLQRNFPRLIKRRTGDIIQSLASCRSSKNGYDHSPPSTPSCDDTNVINEKSTKRRKSAAQQNLSKLRKIFLR